jgi:tyrosyl-tRNA synthetase
MDGIVDILRERGLVEAMTSPDLPRVLAQGSKTVYAGFDPSSDSLQVGNLATIMALTHFQRCGHRVVALVGGATGRIGDPSGKTGERQLLDPETVERHLVGIRENLSRFLDFDHPTAPAKILNNYAWFEHFTFIDFLREIGKRFRVGAMLGRESVRLRMESEAGMSFAEFSYALLQAYDFLKLYDDEQCVCQIGGSDQWGNITAGIELVRKARGQEVFGLTLPLICDRTGKKLGKSEGNAIYLDRRKTSEYDFYQFFVRADDADAVRLLKVYTLLPARDIAQLAASQARHPEKREAQKTLAAETTRRVHGESGLQKALRATDALFGGPLDGLTADDLSHIFADVDSAELTWGQVANRTAVETAVAAGLCASNGEARRLAENGGLYVNNQRVASREERIAPERLTDGRILVLRSGKRHYRLVRVSDPSA